MLLKNGKEISIRKAEKKDAQEIIDYCNTVGGESDNLLFGKDEFGMTLIQEEQFIEEMLPLKTAGLFVALIDGEIASVAHLSNPARQRVKHTSELGVSVRKKFWGIGVATIMLEAVIDFAKASQQIEIIGLSVRSDNLTAQSLYKKLGFVEIGCYAKSVKIEDQYYDNILMNLYL